MIEKIKIGITGAVHPNMPGDDLGVYRQIVSDMIKMQDEYGFELVVIHDVLRSENDAEIARRFIDDNNVDLTMVVCPSLPFGRIILPLARVNSYIGIWSVPEPVKEGVLQLNSFCGLNMLGSIIGNYLQDYNIPYKWFYDYPETELFRGRFRVTVNALRGIKYLRESRIGIVGDLANGFENMYSDERELEKKFGTYVQSRHTVEEIVARAKKYSEKEVAETLAEYAREGTRADNRVTDTSMEKAARVNRALLDFAEENKYNALAISCWSRFQEVYDIAVCAPMSRLNEAGIVAPCEADLTSAVSMLMLNGINGKVSALNDLVALDRDDRSINLWHCGVAAKCWADSRGVSWDTHFNIGSYDGEKWNGEGVISNLQMKPGEVTVCAMNNHFDNFFILTGNIMKDKPGYYGGSGWVTDLKLGDRPIGIEDLINTISVGKVNHHYPTAFGDLHAELYEIAAWKGLALVDKMSYKPYLQRI